MATCRRSLSEGLIIGLLAKSASIFSEGVSVEMLAKSVSIVSRKPAPRWLDITVKFDPLFRGVSQAECVFAPCAIPQEHHEIRIIR